MSDISTTYPGHSVSTTDSNESPIAVNLVRSSALDKIQEFLVQGERRSAYHYALDQKIWAHAMVIASSIDREAWKEVVNEFLKTELGPKDDPGRGSSSDRGFKGTTNVNGREGLRVAYSLYSGQGAAAGEFLLCLSIPNVPYA